MGIKSAAALTNFYSLMRQPHLFCSEDSLVPRAQGLRSTMNGAKTLQMQHFYNRIKQKHLIRRNNGD